jgi:hypothetical protein
VLPVTEEERQGFQRRVLHDHAGQVVLMTERMAELARAVDGHAAVLAAVDAREVRKLEALEGRPARSWRSSRRTARSASRRDEGLGGFGGGRVTCTLLQVAYATLSWRLNAGT